MPKYYALEKSELLLICISLEILQVIHGRKKTGMAYSIVKDLEELEAEESKSISTPMEGKWRKDWQSIIR